MNQKEDDRELGGFGEGGRGGKKKRRKRIQNLFSVQQKVEFQEKK